MAKRIVPSDRAKERASRKSNVDMTGMDPEMQETLRGEETRKYTMDEVMAPWAAGVKREDFGDVQKGKSSTAPKPKKKGMMEMLGSLVGKKRK